MQAQGHMQLQQQQPPPTVMISGLDGQNSQVLQQQQGPPGMNQAFTQGPGQMPPGGYRPQQTNTPMSMFYYYENHYFLIFTN